MHRKKAAVEVTTAEEETHGRNMDETFWGDDLINRDG